MQWMLNATARIALTSGVAAAGAMAAVIGCGRAGASPPAAVSTDSVAIAESIRVGDAVLRGTLLSPLRNAPVPVALIIAGSGPTDRDGNSMLLPGKNNSLRLLAEGLVAHGIASLRYDKRGVGQSSLGVAAEEQLSFGTFADDAVAWGQRLARDPRFSEVAVIGHSEGALLAIMAASRIPASRVVSIAGLGRSGGTVLREQLARQLSGDMMQLVDSMLTVLESGARVQNVPPMLHVLLRPSVQPYLSSFLRVNPGAEAARLDVPLLVVHGTTDAQVGLADAEALAAAATRAELRIVDGMSHVLKLAPPGIARQAAAYTDSTLALAPGLVDTIAAFISRR